MKALPDRLRSCEGSGDCEYDSSPSCCFSFSPNTHTHTHSLTDTHTHTHTHTNTHTHTQTHTHRVIHWRLTFLISVSWLLLSLSPLSLSLIKSLFSWDDLFFCLTET